MGAFQDTALLLVKGYRWLLGCCPRWEFFLWEHQNETILCW